MGNGARAGRGIAGFAGATALLASAALWNGFPLVYSDTGTYLWSSFGLGVPIDRPVFYGVFLAATHLGLSPWGSVLAQAAIVAFLLREVLRAVAPRARSVALPAIAAALAVGTALPWVAGELVPDVFAGVLVLALYLTALRPAQLGAGRRLAVAALAVLAMLVHLSHLLLAATLAATAWAIAAVERGRRGVGSGPRRAWLCIGAAALILPVFNLARTGRASVAPSGAAFVVGRLIDDGIAQRLLDEHCAAESYALCPYREALPRTGLEFVWGADSPLAHIGGIDGCGDACARIARDSLRFYPAMHLRAALADTARQLGAFRTGDGLAPYGPETRASAVLHRHFPRQAAAFEASRQQRGALRVDALAALHASVVLASALASAALVLRRRTPTAERELHVFVWVALVANAAIAALLSGVYHRYQARLVWLLCFAVLASLAAATSRPDRAP